MASAVQLLLLRLPLAAVFPPKLATTKTLAVAGMSKAEAAAAGDAAKPDPEMGVAGEKEVVAEKAPARRKVAAEEEDPRLRWAFVRKVYCILALQFAVTAAIAVVAWAVRPIPRFFAAGSLASWLVYLAILLCPFIGLCGLLLLLLPSLAWFLDLSFFLPWWYLIGVLGFAQCCGRCSSTGRSTP